MPTPFDALEDAVSAEVDALFGESFEFRPFTVLPNQRPQPDSGRAVVPFVAVFDERPLFMEPQSAGQPDFKRISTGRDDTRAIISVDDVHLARISRKSGDRVLRLKTGDLYELQNPRPDGMGRTVFPLRYIQRETP